MTRPPVTSVSRTFPQLASPFPLELQALAQQQERYRQVVCAAIQTIHTLGPYGTNLAAAAWTWFDKRATGGSVSLYQTVEEAIAAMPCTEADALMTCAVYPNLHHVVFSNLSSLQFIDCFIFPTFPMVMASRDGRMPQTISTHPAPQDLVPPQLERVLTTSNAQAARDCRDGRTDGCITTLAAMEIHGLKLVTNFGPVPMVYTLHGHGRVHAGGADHAAPNMVE